MEVFTDTGEEGNSKIPGCYVKAGNFGLGNQQSTATQRMGLCQVLMVEHWRLRLLYLHVPMSCSHRRMAFPKSTITRFLIQRGRAKTLQSSSRTNGAQSRAPVRLRGSGAFGGAHLGSFFLWHAFSIRKMTIQA